MNICFVYDIKEKLFSKSFQGVVKELKTELFSSSEANQIIRALKKLGHNVFVIDGTFEFLRRMSWCKKNIDLVFNESKGLFGPERKLFLPALCELNRIHYLGSGPYVLTLARNKWHTRAVAKNAGLRIPHALLIRDVNELKKYHWRSYPAIVKPNYESSSIGINSSSVVYNSSDLKKQIEFIIEKYKQPALVEQFVQGKEIQIAIIGNEALNVLPVVEITDIKGQSMGNRFITNQDWIDHKVLFSIIGLTEPVIRAIYVAKKFYRDLGIRDYGRLDFRIEDKEAFFIEAATHPHITLQSSFFFAASHMGYNYPQFISELLRQAISRATAK